jgi:hypothetical protein
MIVVHFTKLSALYQCIVISSLRGRLENPIFTILYPSFGVWPRDHYMPLQMSILDRMSCFAIGFPLLDRTQYPQAPFVVAKVSLSEYNTIPSGPSCTLWPCRYRHTSPTHPTRQLTSGFLISQQSIPYQTRGGTCCPEVSTPKIWSLADSSITNHITWWIPIISTIPTLLNPQHRASPRSTQISTDGKP